MSKIKKEKLILAIGKAFKELRINKGYSSYENFANDYQIDRKQYWRIENGNNLTVSSIFKILEIHKMKLSDFFVEVEKKL